MAVRGSRSPGGPLHFTQTQEHVRTHKHSLTHTHTAGMLGCWIWPSILADGLGATLSVTIVTCSLFPLSPCLSLPLSSAKRRKMADKILPQRVRLLIFYFIFLPLLLCLCLCVCVSGEKNPGRLFDVGGFLERRRGPDDYVLFPNEKREDEVERFRVCFF